MAEIAVDFLLGCGVASRAIAWFGQGRHGWSHAASVLADGRYLDARDTALDGIPAGVHIREAKSETWIKKRRATLAVTPAEYAAWEANLRAKITDNYGTSDIWGFVRGHAKHLAGHWICSALALNAVQHIKKVPFPLPVPAHEVTPNDLLLILATAGFTIGPVMVP